MTALVVSVILNSNHRADTLQCLRSLARQTYRHRHDIVLDNQSTDGSAEAIRRDYPDVEIITLEDNRGYAGNNNVGVRAAMARGADWILVLNEDTTLAPDCLERLVEIGDRDPRVGILGPMVYHDDEPDVIQSAGGMLGRSWRSTHLGKNERDRGQYVTPHQVEWISGCGLMVRRAVVGDVGALDERFFLYWEETEWCTRAREAGWRIIHVPAAKMWHKGVQRAPRPTPSQIYYDARNHLLLLATHRAPLVAWLYVWGQLLRTLVSWTVRPKWRAMSAHRNALWHGIVDFIRQRWGQMPQRG